MNCNFTNITSLLEALVDDDADMPVHLVVQGARNGVRVALVGYHRGVEMQLLDPRSGETPLVAEAMCVRDALVVLEDLCRQ